jgi:hypothetical protein
MLGLGRGIALADRPRSNASTSSALPRAADQGAERDVRRRRVDRVRAQHEECERVRQRVDDRWLRVARDDHRARTMGDQVLGHRPDEAIVCARSLAEARESRGWQGRGSDCGEKGRRDRRVCDLRDLAGCVRRPCTDQDGDPLPLVENGYPSSLSSSWTR